MNVKGPKRIKTFAFVDASNIIYGAKAEGWFIDQKKLLNYLKNKFDVSKAFFYYGKDPKNKKKESFLNKLRQFGYTLRVKEIKRIKKEGDPKLESSLSFIDV